MASKTKSIKNLIANKTISKCIKELQKLEAGGYGDCKIEISSKVKTSGFSYQVLNGITINTEKKKNGRGETSCCVPIDDYGYTKDETNYNHLLSGEKLTFQFDPKRNTGYYGRIPSSEFIGYADLCDLVGFTTGELMPEDRGWLKFYYHGDVLYIPQHPIRYNISWDDIKNAGLVYGRDITINGVEYEISLLTGASSDPIDDEPYCNATAEEEHEIDLGNGSMWNELIYRVHQDIPGVTDKEQRGSGGPQHGDNWDTLTDEDLNINWTNCIVGTITWCIEASSYGIRDNSSFGISSRLIRGYYRLAYIGRYIPSRSNNRYAWRPVLKVKR